MNRTVPAMLAVGILVTVGAVGFYLRFVNIPDEPSVDRGEDFGMGFRLENSTGDNWTILVVAGSYASTGVRMTVTDPGTGNITVEKRIADLALAKNDPDALYIDSLANGKFDTGDTLVLKVSSPNIKTGYKVQFLRGDRVVGVIKELP